METNLELHVTQSGLNKMCPKFSSTDLSKHFELLKFDLSEFTQTDYSISYLVPSL